MSLILEESPLSLRPWGLVSYKKRVYEWKWDIIRLSILVNSRPLVGTTLQIKVNQAFVPPANIYFPQEFKCNGQILVCKNIPEVKWTFCCLFTFLSKWSVKTCLNFSYPSQKHFSNHTHPQTFKQNRCI